jgi:hypothetical protein
VHQVEDDLLLQGLERLGLVDLTSDRLRHGSETIC